MYVSVNLTTEHNDKYMRMCTNLIATDAEHLICQELVSTVIYDISNNTTSGELLIFSIWLVVQKMLLSDHISSISVMNWHRPARPGDDVL